jgi:hypothetical protein
MFKCEVKISLSSFIFKTLNPFKKKGYSTPHAAEFRVWVYQSMVAVCKKYGHYRKCSGSGCDKWRTLKKYPKRNKGVKDSL